MARVGEPSFYLMSAISPDGSQIAAVKVDPDSDTMTSGSTTSRPGAAAPHQRRAARADAGVVGDVQTIAFTSARGNTFGIYRRAADGSGLKSGLYAAHRRRDDLPDRLVVGRQAAYVLANDTVWVMRVAGRRWRCRSQRTRRTLLADGKLLSFAP